MGDVSEHFSYSEVECNCGCGYAKVDDFLVEGLEDAREFAELGSGREIPFIITSWCRCPTWNKESGGKKNSAHLRGKAVDVLCDNSGDRYWIMYAAFQAGFTRIGIHDEFIHLDVDGDLPEYKNWLY